MSSAINTTQALPNSATTDQDGDETIKVTTAKSATTAATKQTAVEVEAVRKVRFSETDHSESDGDETAVNAKIYEIESRKNRTSCSIT